MAPIIPSDCPTIDITTLATWECPICELENTNFLIEGQSLPDELQCSFCGHESGLIDWLF